MKLVHVGKIWDHDDHNAMTDLISFNGIWLCCFREGAFHVGGRDGCIRILKSLDGYTWESVAYFELEGSDLRDPKLSIMPDGRLIMSAGELTHSGKKFFGRHVQVAFSNDGSEWSKLHCTTPDDVMWLWRLTWHNDVGYGVAYHHPAKNECEVNLWKTNNGIDYEKICNLDVPGRASEATLRFLENDEMVCLIRREDKENASGWLGRALPPYDSWTWIECDKRISGQDLQITDDGRWIVGTRLYYLDQTPRYVTTSLCELNPQTGSLTELYELPSGGDCSYPGIAVNGSDCMISYYSSHEGKSSIYCARFLL